MRKLGLTLVILLGLAIDSALGQAVTATPVRVVIPTNAPAQVTLEVVETALPTWTPTEEGPPLLESKADAGEINVRAEPDPTSQRLGSIKPGERYIVRARYFSWYQFDFPSSPTGTGWVYGELVQIIGNPSKIPDTNPYALPTSASDAFATRTTEALLAVPGGELTATALGRVLSLPTVTPDFSAQSSTINVLPTYTPPADVSAPSASMPVLEEDVPLTLEGAITTVTQQGIPPIVPILGLGAVGVLGLLVSFLRR